MKRVMTEFYLRSNGELSKDQRFIQKRFHGSNLSVNERALSIRTMTAYDPEMSGLRTLE
jgi:hypothetical protein